MEDVNQNTASHVAAWEAHFAALDGGGDGRWEELTAKELCKLLARSSLGLYAPMDEMGDAAEKVGFGHGNIVSVTPGVTHVVTLITFVDEEQFTLPEGAGEAA